MGEHKARTKQWLVDQRNIWSVSTHQSTGCSTRWAVFGPPVHQRVPTSCVSACRSFSFCGTVSSTPSPRRKFNRSSCSVSSKLMARYAPTPTTPVASWMLFPLTRPTSTSACSTMPRAVSSCTGWTTRTSQRKRTTSFAVARSWHGEPRVCHTSPPTTAAPFGTPTPTPKCTTDMIKFETGATVVITKGQNQGRVGVITGREKHIGSFEIVHVKDSKQRSFATRISNVFCIASKDDDTMVSLPLGKGLRDNILEERKKRLGY